MDAPHSLDAPCFSPVSPCSCSLSLAPPALASPAGDRVFALTHRCVGAYTSRIVLPEAALARIPEGKSFEDAAAFPLAALTAWQVSWCASWGICSFLLRLVWQCPRSPCRRLCQCATCYPNFLTSLHPRHWSWLACSRASGCWCTPAPAAWAPLRSRWAAAGGRAAFRAVCATPGQWLRPCTCSP